MDVTIEGDERSRSCGPQSGLGREFIEVCVKVLIRPAATIISAMVQMIVTLVVTTMMTSTG
jgi:hypothetical protein